jgi:hypothetical protein
MRAMHRKNANRRDWERRRVELEWQLAQLLQREGSRTAAYGDASATAHDDEPGIDRRRHEADVDDAAEWRTRSAEGPAVDATLDALRRHLADAPPDPYGGESWAALSARLRAASGFCCRVCEADFADAPALLHVHHRDRNKRNNAPDNLVVVCILCHAEAPGHAHLLQTLDRDTLSRLNAPWRVPYRKRRLDLLLPPA